MATRLKKILTISTVTAIFCALTWMVFFRQITHDPIQIKIVNQFNGDLSASLWINKLELKKIQINGEGETTTEIDLSEIHALIDQSKMETGSLSLAIDYQGTQKTVVLNGYIDRVTDYLAGKIFIIDITSSLEIKATRATKVDDM